MPVESINTPLQAFTYIGSNLIILLTIVSILTFLFLKGYDFIMKNNSNVDLIYLTVPFITIFLYLLY